MRFLSKDRKKDEVIDLGLGRTVRAVEGGNNGINRRTGFPVHLGLGLSLLHSHEFPFDTASSSTLSVSEGQTAQGLSKREEGCSREKRLG